MPLTLIVMCFGGGTRARACGVTQSDEARKYRVDLNWQGKGIGFLVSRLPERETSSSRLIPIKATLNVYQLGLSMGRGCDASDALAAAEEEHAA